MTMPARRILAIAVFAAAAIALSPAETVAIEYYYDNLAGAGFGIAGGTWGTNNVISTDPTGVAAAANTTTTTADTLNLGTSTLGLGAGTITVVAGGRSIGSIIRGSASNSGIIQVNGGTTTFAAAGSVTNNGAGQSLYLGTLIAGASTSMSYTSVGGFANIQIYNAANSYAGATIIGVNCQVRLDSVNDGGVNSTLGSSSSAASNLILENSADLWYTGGVDSTNRNFTINGASATLTARGSGIVTWNGTAAYGGPANEAKTFNLATSSAAAAGGTFSGILVDNGSGQLSLVKSGTSLAAASHWTLNNANTFTGSTTITGGILSLGNANALQNSYINTTASATGTTTTGLRTTGAALNLGGLSGNKSLSTIYTSSTGGYGTVTGITLNVAAANNLSYSGVIDGSRSLTKTGAGTQSLSGTNAYTGTTTVSNGTLRVNGTHTGGGLYTVGAVGTLGGSGSTASALDVSGTLSPGASVESFASGALTMNNGATVQYELDSSAPLSAGADLQIVNGNLTIANGGSDIVNLTLTDLNGTPTAFSPGTTFSVINYSGSWNGGLFDVGGNEIVDGGTFTVGLNTWELDYNAGTGGSNFVGDHIAGSFVNIVAVVPEPTSLALAAAAGVVGLVALRRRRRA